MSRFLKILFGLIFKKLFYNILIIYFSSKIKNLYPINNNYINVLALDHIRFTEDLNSLNNLKKINIFYFDTTHQDKLNILSEITFLNLFNKNFQLNNFKFTYEGKIFIRKLVTKILYKKKIKCVLSCGFYYKRNINWEKALYQSNTPFFCYHKESIGISKKIDFLSNYPVYKKMRFFYGDKLFVGNNHISELLGKLNNDFKDKIIVTGSLKIDNLINEYKNFKKISHNKRRVITLFSFYHSYLLQDITYRLGKWSPDYSFGFCKLFDSVHQVVAKYALENSNVDIFIKLKWQDNLWKKYILSALKKINIDPKNIKNLKFVDNISAQKLIFNSDTVIAFNSSVLTESLLLNKKTIIPIYFEAEDKYSDYVLWKDKDIFNKVYSEDDLYKEIKIFQTQNKFENNVNKLKVLKEAFGYVDGNNSQRMYETMLEYIKN